MPGNGISAHDASGATDNTHSPDSGNLADATLLRRITSPADVKALSPNTLNEQCSCRYRRWFAKLGRGI